MAISRKQIAEHFNVNISNVKMIEAKQLYIVDLPSGIVLVSYWTIVGKLINNTWYLTTQKYSVTTTQQMNYFSRSHNVKYVNDINNITEQEL